MSDPKLIDPYKVPAQPRANEADIQAQREWQETGLVPMAYVQDALSGRFSSGQSITELVLANLGRSGQHPATVDAAPTSNRGK